MALEIKPCPFCGGEGAVLKGHTRWFVECQNMKCGLTPMAIADTKAKSICRWNERTLEDEIEAEAGTMRMLREMAQGMGYEDALQAMEHLAQMKKDGVEALMRLCDATRTTSTNEWE